MLPEFRRNSLCAPSAFRGRGKRHLCPALLSFCGRLVSSLPLSPVLVAPESPRPKTGHSGGSCSNLDVLRPRSETPRVRVQLAAETDDERELPSRGRSRQQRKSERLLRDMRRGEEGAEVAFGRRRAKRLAKIRFHKFRGPAPLRVPTALFLPLRCSGPRRVVGGIRGLGANEGRAVSSPPRDILRRLPLCPAAPAEGFPQKGAPWVPVMRSVVKGRPDAI